MRYVVSLLINIKINLPFNINDIILHPKRLKSKIGSCQSEFVSVPSLNFVNLPCLNTVKRYLISCAPTHSLDTRLQQHSLSCTLCQKRISILSPNFNQGSPKLTQCVGGWHCQFWSSLCVFRVSFSSCVSCQTQQSLLYGVGLYFYSRSRGAVAFAFP